MKTVTNVAMLKRGLYFTRNKTSGGRKVVLSALINDHTISEDELKSAIRTLDDEIYFEFDNLWKSKPVVDMLRLAGCMTEEDERSYAAYLKSGETND